MRVEIRVNVVIFYFWFLSMGNFIFKEFVKSKKFKILLSKKFLKLICFIIFFVIMLILN